MAQSLKGDGKMIFTIFIGAIIAVVFLASIGNSVFEQTNTGTATNVSFTGAAINTSLALEGRELIVGTSVINGTNITLISGGVILATGTVNGVQTVTVTINDTATALVGTLMNATYTFNPDGYLSDSGSRSITNLIVLFGALAILVFLVVVLFKEGSFAELIAKGRKR